MIAIRSDLKTFYTNNVIALTTNNMLARLPIPPLVHFRLASLLTNSFNIIVKKSTRALFLISLRGSPATNPLLSYIIRLSLFIKLVKQCPNSYVFSTSIVLITYQYSHD